ncbi:putative uncharacterized protein [Eubacterium sp. CAG:202]|nr:putative uncharacterized protein [Eubacterium sp. CAG:202]
MVCLFVTVCKSLFLLSKSFSLVDRVVKLGVSVTHFPSIDKELKSLYLFRVIRLFLCKRRNSKRMIHNKCRLDKILFAELFKEKVYDIALCMALFKFNVLLSCKSLSLFVCLYFVKVNSRIFFNAVNHCNSLKRLTEINFNAVICYYRTAAYLFCEIFKHTLCKVHHTVVIGVCLIKFHKCKFRVVSCVYTLITKYSSDFVNFLKTADNKSFKVKFKRNTKFYIFVKCIVMSFKRSCCRTACICNKHRGFNFHKFSFIKEVTDFFDYF